MSVKANMPRNLASRRDFSARLTKSNETLEFQLFGQTQLLRWLAGLPTVGEQPFVQFWVRVSLRPGVM